MAVDPDTHKSAPANRRSAGQLDSSGGFVSDHRSRSASPAAVAKLTSEVIRQAVFLRFFRTGFDGGFSQFNLIEQAD
jgi:hypothetical protein